MNFTEILEKWKNDPKHIEFIEKLKAAAAEQKMKNSTKSSTFKTLQEMAEKAKAYDILMGGDR